jgi:copper chaperone CopZ
MYKILVVFMAFTVSSVSAMEKSGGHGYDSHNHEHHQYSVHGNVKVSDTAFPDKMFSVFTSDLKNVQVVVVDVNGMVCDFCARGIEKVLYTDDAVKKVRVSLELGKFLIAYSPSKKVDFEEIKNIFLSNGQNTTGYIIKKI